jgi:hypothetical protein
MTKTYNQFKTLGHLVKKGEKSIGKNENGQSMFRLDQTLPVTSEVYAYEELEDGKLSEQEIQELVAYRRMMRGWVNDAASRGNKICGSYLALLNSHPLAMQIDRDLDYSEDSDDIEMHY